MQDITDHHLRDAVEELPRAQVPLVAEIPPRPRLAVHVDAVEASQTQRRL